ncbi:tetraprenyl-beta-curcumene synthase family protein [Oceanobacillus piezotolerans]|uniref:Tetraprenyl-beta-curcumene synthase family protein n=2 Tax=Oceanobacillus piezotolerans TaxID=2448030 RepID=A0A498D8R3_9BACI|nr:tetraprenyl-beta-curcumene synthase family protein [Oceanobacillus piezotolerans]RLL47115.1 tetraprenyl-beta-curcumene synthase family protein [Oceanobacillus piezotolerans]
MSLLTGVYRRTYPEVNRELDYWRERANKIPNKELRSQALASMNAKRFHCQGGAVYALITGENWRKVVQFIVAYQTISDYLDNLCDRSTSLDPKDFTRLHEAMKDALTPGNALEDYYEYREDQDDGGYLHELIQTCQQVLANLKQYHVIKPLLLSLEDKYANLQIHKHVKQSERVPRLKSWHESNQSEAPELTWYEYAAASGSTLGVFCLVAYAHTDKMNPELANKIYDSYFPYMQGLHILLDYFIDQKEDEIEGDLNFCTYYSSKEKLKERFLYFIEQTDKAVQKLPDSDFHRMIHHGLVGLYLSDKKVNDLEDSYSIVKDLLSTSGRKAKFFHWNIRLYHKLEEIS